MAYDTFSPPRPPSPPLNITATPRVLRVALGDGYVSTAADGLNAVPYNGALVWNVLSLAEFTAIKNFVESHIGLVFYYTLPWETTARKWSIKDYTPAAQATTYSIQLLIEERFDP